MSNNVISLNTANAMLTAAAIKLDAGSGKGRIHACALQVACTADDTTNTFTLVAHGFNDLDRVKQGGTAVPADIDDELFYYVRNKTDDTYQLSETSGGAIKTFSDDGTDVTVKVRLLMLELNTTAYTPIVDNVATLNVSSAITNKPDKVGNIHNCDLTDSDDNQSRYCLAATSGGALNFDTLLTDLLVDNNVLNGTLIQDLGSV